MLFFEENDDDRGKDAEEKSADRSLNKNVKSLINGRIVSFSQNEEYINSCKLLKKIQKFHDKVVENLYIV